jgi:hypothetical protein
MWTAKQLTYCNFTDPKKYAFNLKVTQPIMAPGCGDGLGNSIELLPYIFGGVLVAAMNVVLAIFVPEIEPFIPGITRTLFSFTVTAAGVFYGKAITTNFLTDYADNKYYTEHAAFIFLFGVGFTAGATVMSIVELGNIANYAAGAAAGYSLAEAFWYPFYLTLIPGTDVLSVVNSILLRFEWLFRVLGNPFGPIGWIYEGIEYGICKTNAAAASDPCTQKNNPKARAWDLPQIAAAMTYDAMKELGVKDEADPVATFMMRAFLTNPKFWTISAAHNPTGKFPYGSYSYSGPGEPAWTGYGGHSEPATSPISFMAAGFFGSVRQNTTIVNSDPLVEVIPNSWAKMSCNRWDTGLKKTFPILQQWIDEMVLKMQMNPQLHAEFQGGNFVGPQAFIDNTGKAVYPGVQAPWQVLANSVTSLEGYYVGIIDMGQDLPVWKLTGPGSAKAQFGWQLEAAINTRALLRGQDVFVSYEQIKAGMKARAGLHFWESLSEKDLIPSDAGVINLWFKVPEFVTNPKISKNPLIPTPKAFMKMVADMQASFPGWMVTWAKGKT